MEKNDIHLDTNNQAEAVSVTLHKTITICNLYIPPASNRTADDIVNIIIQCPKRFVRLDFDAHNTLWENKYIDVKYRIIEQIINDQNLCFFNDT